MSLLARQLLVCLLTAHLLGDFLLQSDRVARDKRRIGVLLQHAFTVALLSYLACGAWRNWFIPVSVFGAHALIDAVKARVTRQDATTFLLDQLAHAISLAVIAILAAGSSPSLYGVDLLGATYLRALIAVGGVVLGVFAGGVLIGLAVQPLLEQLKQARAASREQVSQESRGFEEGGKLIGRLERALIFLFVFSGQPAGIGFLIAAKSIFRFGELKEHRHRMEAEYIIIGTMMSFGIGLLVAHTTRLLMSLDWV